MPYVSRNAAGQIIALHRGAGPGASEYLQPTDPEVHRFLGVDDAPGGDGFAPLDGDFVRVLEDVVDTLIRKGLLTITDLPEAAQAKLFARKGRRLREHVRGDSLGFDTTGFPEVIDDSSFGGLSSL